MKLITFEGRFSMDQLLAIALLRMVGYVTCIRRRRPTLNELQDPVVLVVNEFGGVDRPATNNYNSSISVLEGNTAWCRIRCTAPKYWRWLRSRLVLPVSELESGVNCLAQDELPPQLPEVVSWFNQDKEQGFEKALAFVEEMLVTACMAARADDWEQQSPQVAGYPGRCICG
jgi:uncharacterized UPF0160 family protein